MPGGCDVPFSLPTVVGAEKTEKVGEGAGVWKSIQECPHNPKGPKAGRSLPQLGWLISQL